MILKVGVAALGESGWKIHCENLQKMEKYKIAAVYDTDEEKVKEASQVFGTKSYFEYAQLLADPEINLVVIASPSSLHVQMAVQAMETGKNVVIDKPICTTLREAEAMIEIARKNNVILYPFHERRWDSDYLLIKEVIKDGLLGVPFVIESRISGYGKYPGDWRLKEDQAGGLLYDWGPHLFDQILLMVSSKPIQVFCNMQSQIWSNQVDTYFKCIICFASGLVAQIEASNISQIKLPRWFILGDKGALRIDDRDALIHTKMNNLEGEFIPHYEQRTIGDNVCRLYDNIYEVLTEGKEPAIKIKEVKEVVKIIEIARQSAEIGEAIRVAI